MEEDNFEKETIEEQAEASAITSPNFRKNAVIALKLSGFVLLSWWLIPQLVSGPLWLVILGIMSVAFLIYVFQNCVHKGKAKKRSYEYNEENFISRWLVKNSYLKIVCRTILVLVMATWWLIKFGMYSGEDWLWFAATVFLCWPGFYLMNRVATYLFKNELVLFRTLSYTRYLVPTFICILYGIRMLWGDFPHYPSLEASIEAVQNQLPQYQCASVNSVIFVLARLTGISNYLSGLPESFWGHMGAAVLVATSAWPLSWVSSTLTSTLLLPGGEIKNNLPCAGKNKFWCAFWMVIIILCLISLFANIEQVAKTHSKEIQAGEEWVDTKLVAKITKVIKVGQELYHAEAKQDLQRLLISDFTNFQAAKKDMADRCQQMISHIDQLKEKVTQRFAAAEGYVDDYLDWYFSLIGDYARLIKILTGNLEGYMTEKVREMVWEPANIPTLTDEWDSLAAMERELCGRLQGYVEFYSNLKAQLKKRAKAVLERHRFQGEQTTDGRIEVIKSFSGLDDLLTSNYLAKPEIISIIQKQISMDRLSMLRGSMPAIGMAVGGVIGAKMGAKKLGAIAAKILAKKLGSKILGITTGGAIGSVAGPVGSVAGALVGLGASLLVEKLWIEGEELFNRDEMRAELISALEELRDDFIAQLDDMRDKWEKLLSDLAAR